MTGAEKGISAFVLSAGSLSDVDNLTAGIVVLSAIGLAISWLLGRTDAAGNLWNFLHTGGAQNDRRRARRYMQRSRHRPIRTSRVYLYTPKNIVAMSTKISGFEPVPDGMIRLQGLSMSQ